MAEEPMDFEAIKAAGAALSAGVDQMAAICRPTFETLATWERAGLAAGMSPLAAALYTMKLADAFGWPPAGRNAP